MTKLKIEKLRKEYGRFLALNSIDLEINEGEFVSLLGPSGCGKTTTLRILAGFADPTEGRILVNDNVYSSAGKSLAPERRGMSMIFQSYAIWPNMTVAQNVEFGLRIKKIDRGEREQRMRRILALVQLEALADRYPSELSGGQQQRVALARAIVVYPEVLLLDEPLSNLDASLREEMRAEIRRLHDEFKITSVYVTHDQVEAMSTSDKIVVMNHGNIEQIGSPFEVYHFPQSRFVATFIGKVSLLPIARNGGSYSVAGVERRGGSYSARECTHLAIRPENIRLLKEDDVATNSGLVVSGRVQGRTYLGSCMEYTCKAPDGTDILIHTHPSIGLNPGDEVSLAIDEEFLAPICD